MSVPAVVAATSIPALLSVRTAFAQTTGDGAILQAAIGLEQTAVLAYDTAASSGLLKGPVKAAAERFRRHEQEHADGLIAALRGMGGTSPPKPNSARDVPGLSSVASQADVLSFAIELEMMAVAAYYDAAQKLKDASLLQTAVAIMANEGQHLVVLRHAAGRNRVPNAFETGKP